MGYIVCGTVFMQLYDFGWQNRTVCKWTGKENNSCHPGAHRNLSMCLGINLVQKRETERSSLF